MGLLSIKTKQVAGVTLMVTVTVVVLSAWSLSSLLTVRLEETHARAQLVAKALYHRAFAAVQEGGDPIAALRNDKGLRSILEAGGFSGGVLYAALVDGQGIVIMDPQGQDEGKPLQPREDFETLLKAGPLAQVRAIYTPGDRQYEVRGEPLMNGDQTIAGVRVVVSTLFIHEQFGSAMFTPLLTAGGIIIVSTLVALLLAQIGLRPIHVITSGLARLGRGELDVSVDLPADADLGDLGDSFKAVSARLAADRTALVGQRATLESVVDHLEDAVAVFSPDGALLFANAAMQPLLAAPAGHVSTLFPPAHPCRVAVEAVIAGGTARTPETVGIADREFLILTHPVGDTGTAPHGAVLVARNLTYLGQVESTITYSRKLAALGRLSAGIAHEVKNPLNAAMIHLELLRMNLVDQPDALEHVRVIAAQVRRLDEVVQGLLKFNRPEDLKLQPVAIGPIFAEIMPVIAAEASKSHVDVRLELADNLPPARADASLLQQAFLNLALNACQAMPHGGRLRIAASVVSAHRLEVIFEDSGVGIPPEQLSRIFDLYYTTKETGSGIGLSLVYRAVQLQDGDIEVQSSPGRGTTFRVVLPTAKLPSPFATLAAS